ncbi:a-factor receptor [Orbilia ellipsospora]|uniref:A-factor receptor n=1 Tax=Orbilia ellipsospora TaxID=2528407 RepID=A0AAV9XRW7_9PEZI
MPITAEPIIFVICSVSAIILLIIPLMWQMRKTNIAAILLVFWLQTDILLCGIDAIIWPTWHSVITGWQGKGYCDFVAKWRVAAEFGAVNACVFCIMITIYRMFSGLSLYRETHQSKRLRTIYEWGIGGLFPVLLAGLHYVVQPSRYYLTPIFGCHPPIDNSWVSLIIVGWPVLFSTMSIVLVGGILLRVRVHMEERTIMGVYRSRSGLDAGFRRLYMMSCLFLLIYYPTNVYGFIEFCLSEMLPYSWSAVHADWWDTIYKLPDNPHFQYQRWVKIVASWILFWIFGQGEEAEQIYWQISCFFGVSRQVQQMVWKYKIIKRNMKNTWLPKLAKITPEWMEGQRQSIELPLGGIVRPPARPASGLSAFIKWCRDKIKGQGEIHLDSCSSVHGATTMTDDAPSENPLRLTFMERMKRAFRRIPRPKIHFEFSITWIRDSIYKAPSLLSLSRFRLSAAQLDPPFLSTFDSTTLEKIAQQAGHQVDAELRQSQSGTDLASPVRTEHTRTKEEYVITPSRPMNLILADFRERQRRAAGIINDEDPDEKKEKEEGDEDKEDNNKDKEDEVTVPGPVHKVD